MAGNRRKWRTDEEETVSEARMRCETLMECAAACSEMRGGADDLAAFAAALAKAGRYLESFDPEDDAHWADLKKAYMKCSRDFVLLLGSTDLPLVSGLRNEHGFSGEELEVALILAASALGTAVSINDIGDLQSTFPAFRRSGMETARLLLPEGRLVMSGLVLLEEEALFKNCSIAADPKFVEAVLRGKESFSSAWSCGTQEELLKKLSILRRAGEEAADNIEEDCGADREKIRKEKRQFDRFIRLFLRAVRPEWKLAGVFSSGMDADEAAVLLMLLADAVLRGASSGFRMISDEEVCSGENLAKAASNYPGDVNVIVRRHLSTSSRLMREKLIEPLLSGTGEMREDDEDELRNCNFRLTDACLSKIGVKRKRRKGSGGRKPLLRMEQLELSPEVRQALELAVNQYACRDVLDSWQLGKTITYGRAVTMLFYGPPGVGKTAAAEAVASTLKKRILVADYSQIQNCWVGQTEKNIAKLFAKAREDDCVLFWDEADAMFFDRETASHNWEVRDVNVLLQELEKFDGVCILSTNRNVELDKALARRISLKIAFKPPTRAQALSIWNGRLKHRLRVKPAMTCPHSTV